MSRDKVPRAYDLNFRREREMKQIRRDRDDRFRREEYDMNFQPVMMTFKAFLQTQDDSITDEEALVKYGEYKLEFQRQQLNEFFVHHKDYEWFRAKYHPQVVTKRQEDYKTMLLKRLEVYKQLVTEQLLEDFSLDDSNEDKLIELMDKVVVLLEGGSEQDYEEIISKENINDDSKQLHKTTSIFLNNLHPSIKRSELEDVVKKFPGFLRLALSEPDPNNKFVRKCWISFQRNAKIREICFGLNNVKIREHDLKPVVNKDLSKRIRVVDWPVNEANVIQLAIVKCHQLIKTFDKKSTLFDEADNRNPILEIVTENCTDVKVLDRLVLFLRLVYSFDFYNQNEYLIEDEMPNRCGMFHVRPSKTEHEDDPKEVTAYINKIESKLDSYMVEKKEIKEELIVKLGLRKEEDEIEKYMKSNMQELDSEKWLCTLSGKKFKAPEFVRKHILNKFGEKVDEVKLEAAFFNNYIKDENRPKLPTKAPAPARSPAKRPLERPPAPVHHYEDHQRGPPPAPSYDMDDPPAKRSIKDRLGVGGVKVSYNARDPRDIVDYSDVDHFSVNDSVLM